MALEPLASTSPEVVCPASVATTQSPVFAARVRVGVGVGELVPVLEAVYADNVNRTLAVKPKRDTLPSDRKRTVSVLEDDVQVPSEEPLTKVRSGEDEEGPLYSSKKSQHDSVSMNVSEKETL